MEEKNISMEQPNAENAQVASAANEEKAQNEAGLNIEKSGEGFSADGSIGKFKNTESLLNAYNNLQAEFTRKCQKLSELEKSIENTLNKKDEHYRNLELSNLYELGIDEKEFIKNKALYQEKWSNYEYMED